MRSPDGGRGTTDDRRRASKAKRACLIFVALSLVSPVVRRSSSVVQAQRPTADSTAFYKALDLETSGKYKEAAPLFRAALYSSAGTSALLGLERVYAELGWADSLLAPLDSLIAGNPREPIFRTVQLRTLQSIGRETDLRRAFERWVHDAPTDPTPYREYARILLQRNQSVAADSLMSRARTSLGSTKDLQLELAQLRAAQGQWLESAQAWRSALASAGYLEQAAAYALTPTPGAMRQQIREVFLAPPVEVPSRRALAALETSWGSPADGWNALKDLQPDSASAEAWTEFGTRAETEERWSLAREAFESALRWRFKAEIALRAANAALNAGDPAAALRLAPLTAAPADSSAVARSYIPLHARALAMMGRPSEAEKLVTQFDRWLSPGSRANLTRTIAWGWVRTGDMSRARAALSTGGPGGDSSDAAGWLALYEGNIKTARALLRGGSETSPELALALGLVARLKVDSAPAIGRAFLSLARGDSANAAALFVEAADRTPPVASLLLLTAAQIRYAQKDETQALVLWKRVVESEGATPEAPQAELEWARALRRRGDHATAVARLEHLILTYPQSALVPQARRELDLARASIPGGKA
jgi:tetratricopeptide (TPR) repeat protein